MKVTDVGIRQRQQAAVKHRITAFKARGEDALDNAQRSRLVEIASYTEDRDGVLALMQERTAQAVMLAELCEAWIRTQAERGIPFDEMTMLDRITTYQEAARRHLAQLADMLGDGNSPEDITQILSGSAREKQDDD